MRRRELLGGPVLLGAGVRIRGEESWTGTHAGWTGGFPRLYFRREQLEKIRRAPGWPAVLQRADRLLGSALVPEKVAETGGGQHANYGAPSGQISDMGLTLGLAYQATGRKTYAEKLRQTMLAYAGYQRWYGQGLADRTPPWHSELNTARFCYGYAAGYDCIRDYLSTEDRTRIAQAMVRLGILPTLEDWLLPDRRIHALDSMGHNWWSVCVSMAGLAALSLLGDEPRAPDWVDRVAQGLSEWFRYPGNVLQNKAANFDPNGGFYESVSYANYAISEYLRFRLACANVLKSPPPAIPVLAKVQDFMAHNLYPASAGCLAVNFGDAPLRPSGDATMMLLLANHFAGDTARWYLHQTRAAGQDTLSMLLEGNAASAPAAPALQTSAAFYRIGWATLRSSWRNDATLLAVRSGSSWNHAHADAGSFILFHAGKPLLIDSGTCSYNRREYSRYYVQSAAHNVILFNGRGQPENDHNRGAKFPGEIHALLDRLGVKYIYADATGPMARYFVRNYRHWLWIDQAILIFDDVLAYEPGRFDWLLHYAEEARPTGNEVLVTNGNAHATVRFLHPANLVVRNETGLADHRPDLKTSYLAFSPQTAANEQKFIVAVLPHPDGQALPATEALSGPQMLGVRLHDGACITEAYLNLQADGRRMHVNSNNVIDGWETDAYLMALTRPANSTASTPATITRYFVSNGSYLRKNGIVVLDSLTKVDRVWTAAGNRASK